MANIMAKARLSIRERMEKMSIRATSNSAKNMGRGSITGQMGIIMTAIGLTIVQKAKELQ